jgi:hypothetical protein
MCIAGVNAGKHTIVYKNVKAESTYNKLKADTNSTENNELQVKSGKPLIPSKSSLKFKKRNGFIPVVDEHSTKKPSSTQQSALANKHLVVYI